MAKSKWQVVVAAAAAPVSEIVHLCFVTYDIEETALTWVEEEAGLEWAGEEAGLEWAGDATGFCPLQPQSKESSKGGQPYTASQAPAPTRTKPSTSRHTLPQPLTTVDEVSGAKGARVLQAGHQLPTTHDQALTAHVVPDSTVSTGRVGGIVTDEGAVRPRGRVGRPAILGSRHHQGNGPSGICSS